MAIYVNFVEIKLFLVDIFNLLAKYTGKRELDVVCDVTMTI